MKANHLPLISVIIPTYNSERTIKQCLESIKNQTYQKIEIIVVDEYSRDKTRKIAKKYARVYSRRGERSIARNFGIEKAKGKYVLVIDSDMELTSAVIKECVDVAEKNDVIVIPEISVGEGFWADCRKIERSCYYGDDVIEAARFFPKKLILGLGGYDPNIVGAEDWDIHQKIRKKGYNIRRIKSHIIHHEGKVELAKSIKKKMYYGSAFNEFRKRYPHIWRKIFVRTAFLRNWKILVKNPIHALGMVTMKIGEGVGLLIGMLLAKTKSRATHY